jgi:hypothetical protein
MFFKKELNEKSYPATHSHNPKNYIFHLQLLESMWNKNLSNNNMILDLS